MIKTQIELNVDNTSFPVKTDTYSILCGEENLNSLLKELEAQAKDMCFRKIFTKVNYVDNLTKLDIREAGININDISNMFLNGFVLLKDKDFYILNDDFIGINIPNNKNDVFQIETYTKNINLEKYDPKFNLDEKTKLNDIFVKFNLLTALYNRQVVMGED